MGKEIGLVTANFVGEGGKIAANHLRHVADLIESGQVRDMVVIYDHRGENKFSSNGFMDDRWRLLGAIEYAKKYVMD